MSKAKTILPLVMKSHKQRHESVETYVKRIMKQKGIDPKTVSDRAKAKGFKISSGYVGNLAYGAADNPTISIGKALAAGLGEPEDEVFAVLRGESIPEPEGFRKSMFFDLWENYGRLDEEGRSRFDGTLSMLQEGIRSLVKQTMQRGKA